MLRRVLIALLPLAVLGCGGKGPEVAPVSGTVYWDGQPLPNAWVVFQPLGSEANPNPGRGSTGRTDANGRFTLKIDGKKEGAVVGEHKVAIASALADAPVDEEVGSEDGAIPQGREFIPARYNDQTILRFTVTPDGTDKADFKLESDNRTGARR